ncbi:MAG: 3-oxoacyl-ACP reductase FabG [Nevskiaceae bacterium]|nr:MAG: 3-oxoacyl-ACP reductase FabG [Nevskiaceae bacterium]TBR73261.1 MAG: 3-oxoacyl-ACP reductase FabG [Nevskiaceae bacterium]
MFSSLAGRSVIVTGGSKGIGKGIAKAFANEGANVTIVARSGAEVAKTAADLDQECLGKVRACSADVGQEADVARMVENAVDAFGGIDVLCANAGVFPQKKIVDMAVADWDRVLATNLRSTFLCVKAAMPHLQKCGRGRVIVTSSITGPVTGYPGWSHYAASKAGQLGFVRTAAIELAPMGITINAIQPGNIMSDGLADLSDAYLKTMAASIPLKRLGVAKDIAAAALFFAAEEAAYITGQALVVDGGQTLPETLEAIDA